MASMRLFLLLATLALAVAASDYGDNHQAYPMPKEEPKKEEPYPPTKPSCDDCDGLKQRLLLAKNKCCSEVTSEHLECLCPTMNTLIAAGIPLKEVCYDDMACKKYKENNPLYKLVDTGKQCSVPAGVCDELVKILSAQKQNGCTHSSRGSCFTRILSEVIGVDNATKLIMNLNQQ